MTISRIYTNDQAERARSGKSGEYVIIELKNTVSLTPDFGPDRQKDDNGSADEKAGQDNGGPVGGIVAGNKPQREENPSPYNVTVHQLKAIKTVKGKSILDTGSMTETSHLTLIADDFKQFVYKDPKTGVALRYNIYIPKNYNTNTKYPLVLFMHDASGANQVDNYTLLQGNGATVWASPKEQAKHPCIVVAPQYDEIVVDDNFTATSSAETALKLWSSVGTKTASAKWPLDTTRAARVQEVDSLRNTPATIRYSQLQGGWHNGTWRVAYTFEGIRDWLFQQVK